MPGQKEEMVLVKKLWEYMRLHLRPSSAGICSLALREDGVMVASFLFVIISFSFRDFKAARKKL